MTEDVGKSRSKCESLPRGAYINLHGWVRLSRENENTLLIHPLPYTPPCRFSSVNRLKSSMELRVHQALHASDCWLLCSGVLCFVCYVARFPAKLMVPLIYILNLCVVCVPWVQVCFVLWSPVCLIVVGGVLSSVSAFPWISCVVVAPPAGHGNAGFVLVFASSFFSSVCPLLFFSCLVFRLVLSCRPSVGPSPGQIIRLVVAANSNHVPSGLGLHPERILNLELGFVLSFFLFLFTSFLFSFIFALLSSFSGVLYICTTAMLLVSSCCKWYGTLHHSSL